jgi:hypothetical protein
MSGFILSSYMSLFLVCSLLEFSKKVSVSSLSVLRAQASFTLPPLTMLGRRRRMYVLQSCTLFVGFATFWIFVFFRGSCYQRLQNRRLYLKQ